MNTLSFCLACFIALLISGCAQNVTPQTLQPAEVGGAANTRNIALIPLENDYAGLSGKIEATINGQEIDGKPNFTLVNRTELEKLISEQKPENRATLDTTRALRVAKALGAQAVITGSLDNPRVQKNNYDVTRITCKGRDDERKCWEVKVMCKERTIALSADIRIVDVTTAGIIYADTISRENAWHVCADSNHTLPSKKSAVQSVADDIARTLVDRLTPHYRQADTALLEEPDTDSSH